MLQILQVNLTLHKLQFLQQHQDLKDVMVEVHECKPSVKQELEIKVHLTTLAANKKGEKSVIMPDYNQSGGGTLILKVLTSECSKLSLTKGSPARKYDLKGKKPSGKLHFPRLKSTQDRVLRDVMACIYRGREKIQILPGHKVNILSC
ncbi:hypothetical protein AgCh_012750 [Apium graveolens]